MSVTKGASDYASKILKEADWQGDDAAYAEILDLLRDNPKQAGYAVPPLGYEEVLLAKLARKTGSRRQRFLASIRVWDSFAVSKTGWALSIFFLASTMWTGWQWFSAMGEQPGFARGTVRRIVDKSQKVEVRRWLASIGADNSVEREETFSNVDLLSNDPFVIAFDLDNKVLAKVLQKFSRSPNHIHRN
jgi:hypothetical protein